MAWPGPLQSGNGSSFSDDICSVVEGQDTVQRPHFGAVHHLQINRGRVHLRSEPAGPRTRLDTHQRNGFPGFGSAKLPVQKTVNRTFRNLFRIAALLYHIRFATVLLPGIDLESDLLGHLRAGVLTGKCFKPSQPGH